MESSDENMLTIKEAINNLNAKFANEHIACRAVMRGRGLIEGYIIASRANTATPENIFKFELVDGNATGWYKLRNGFIREISGEVEVNISKEFHNVSGTMHNLNLPKEEVNPTEVEA